MNTIFRTSNDIVEFADDDYNYDYEYNYEDQTSTTSSPSGGNSGPSTANCPKTPLNDNQASWQVYCDGYFALKDKKEEENDSKNKPNNTFKGLEKAKGAGTNLGLQFFVDHLACGRLSVEDFDGSLVSQLSPLMFACGVCKSISRL